MDDLLRAQLDHNAWATRRIIEVCRDLPDAAAFTRTFDIGLGTLQSTLTHIIESMFFFADHFRGTTYQPRQEHAAQWTTPDGLLQLLDDADHELQDAVFAYLDVHFLRDDIPWIDGRRSFPAAAVLAQAFDHGTHHRAQCVNMLRRAGVTDLPKTWPLAWASDTSA